MLKLTNDTNRPLFLNPRAIVAMERNGDGTTYVRTEQVLYVVKETPEKIIEEISLLAFHHGADMAAAARTGTFMYEYAGGDGMLVDDLLGDNDQDDDQAKSNVAGGVRTL